MYLHDTAHGPNVCLITMAFFLQHLRSNVVRCTTHRPAKTIAITYNVMLQTACNNYIVFKVVLYVHGIVATWMFLEIIVAEQVLLEMKIPPQHVYNNIYNKKYRNACKLLFGCEEN